MHTICSDDVDWGDIGGGGGGGGEGSGGGNDPGSGGGGNPCNGSGVVVNTALPCGTIDDGGGWDPVLEDIEIGADDSNSDEQLDIGGNNNGITDNSVPPDFDPLMQQWPSIPDFMGVSNFVKRQYPKQNCLLLAQQQIGVSGYFDGGLSQSFQIYTRTTGIDLTQTQKGINYLVNAVQNKIPVIVGIDYGKSSPNSDGTTNHFVVVVGMGSDANGNYFLFYDNFTNQSKYGASSSNKLYYNVTTGAITGTFLVDETGRTLSYQVSMIRKSVK